MLLVAGVRMVLFYTKASFNTSQETELMWCGVTKSGAFEIMAFFIKNIFMRFYPLQLGGGGVLTNPTFHSLSVAPAPAHRSPAWY